MGKTYKANITNSIDQAKPLKLLDSGQGKRPTENANYSRENQKLNNVGSGDYSGILPF